MAYDHKTIDSKWVEKWKSDKTYESDKSNNGTPVYMLGMFPYPSGAGLHVGHVRIYTACDVMARFYRMNGCDLLFPMGWDAFGLPAENAAIKEHKNPMDMVPVNEANFKRQMQMMGLSYDWNHELSTTDPEYYKWTQWLFLKLYSIKNDRGERLIYRREVPINWCPFCKTGLANEEVLSDGTHERCGKPVEKKLLPQWVMRITDYADRLLRDLDEVRWIDEQGKERKGLDWPTGILEMQRNWIGKKEGINIKFPVSNFQFSKDLTVFTTRVDTIFGVTFLAIAPEIADVWIQAGWSASQDVKNYINTALNKTEEQRKVGEKEKTGIDTGLKAVNPVSGQEVPVYIADYILTDVGTGCVMGVPAHDERDYDFAKKFKLQIKKVVIGADDQRDGELTKVYTEYGTLIRSGEFDGLTSQEAMRIIPEKFPLIMIKNVHYHLRDWVFSRQRYWGEPFPLIYCDKCGDENGVVTVAESELPVKLPHLKSYEPTDTGESPLARVTDWVNVTCPKCGGKARRETDTMPNWAGSCWYYLAFPWWEKQKYEVRSTEYKDLGEQWEEFKEEMNERLPVNWYLGGAEHAVLHLLYARFWVKAFKDLGLLSFSEPFSRLRSVGMVLAEDGRKMSKSFGNVINPDDMVDQFGADAVRLYEMFMGPWEATIAWDTRALVGCKRFVDRIWKLTGEQTSSQQVSKSGIERKLKVTLHKTIKKVSEDIPLQKFNTAIAAMMEFVNEWDKEKCLALEDIKVFIRLLSPFAPFLAEELWAKLDDETTRRRDDSLNHSVHLQSWPVYDSQLIMGEEYLIVVQVNGKMRQSLTIPAIEYDQWENKQEQAELRAKSDLKVYRWIEGKEIVKVVYIPPTAEKQGLINLVIKT